MRTLWIAALVLVPTVAAADVQSKCYAGSETVVIGTKSIAVKAVVERSQDPAANELREHAWIAGPVKKERNMVAKVDVKTNTFTFNDDASGYAGTGKLVGKAWAWTTSSYTAANADKGIEVTGETVREGDKLHGKQSVTKGGKVVGTTSGEFTTFDCKDLNAQRDAIWK